MPNLRTITQTVIFKTTPTEVYSALMDSEKHAAFTESKAIISPKASGDISAYDGYITGTNVKLVPDKIIVQRWRAEDWPIGHFSTITIELKKHDETDTVMHFTQTGVPSDFYTSIANGWKKHYWTKMKTVFGW